MKDIKIKDIEKISSKVKLIYNLLTYFINQEYSTRELIETTNNKDLELRKVVRKANGKYHITQTFLDIFFDSSLKIKEDLEEIIITYYEADEEKSV